jgi:hypothetical protein
LFCACAYTAKAVKKINAAIGLIMRKLSFQYLKRRGRKPVR